MKKMMLVVVLGVLSACSGEGIVSIPGWAHGVALCGNTDYQVTYGRDIMVGDNMALYVVNAGHAGDTEVYDLQAKAHEVCAAFLKNK